MWDIMSYHRLMAAPSIRNYGSGLFSIMYLCRLNVVIQLYINIILACFCCYR